MLRVALEDTFAVAVHPRDGGRSVDTLRNGLPQSHCFDLANCQGLAVAGDARSLLLGTTTGNL